MQEPGSPLVPLDPSRFREMVEKQQVVKQHPPPQPHQIESPTAPSPLPLPQQQHPMANQYYRENLTRTQSASSVGSVESGGSSAAAIHASGQFQQQQMSPQYSPHVAGQQRFWYPNAHSSPRSAYFGPNPPPPSSQGSAQQQQQQQQQQPMTPQPVRTPQSAGSVGSPRMPLQTSHTPASQVMSPDPTHSSPSSARSPMGSPIQQGPPLSAPLSMQQGGRMRAPLPLTAPNPPLPQSTALYQQQQPMMIQHQQSSYPQPQPPPNYQQMLPQQQQQPPFSPNYGAMQAGGGGGRTPQASYPRPPQYPPQSPSAARPGAMVMQQQLLQPGPNRPTMMVRQPHYMMYRPPPVPMGHPGAPAGASGQFPPNNYHQMQSPQQQPPGGPYRNQGGGFASAPGAQMSYAPSMDEQADGGVGGGGSHFINTSPGGGGQIGSMQSPQQQQRYQPSMIGGAQDHASGGGMMSPPVTQQRPGPAMTPMTPTYGPPPTPGAQQQLGRPMQQQQYPGGVNINSQQAAAAAASAISPVSAGSHHLQHPQHPQHIQQHQHQHHLQQQQSPVAATVVYPHQQQQQVRYQQHPNVISYQSIHQQQQPPILRTSIATAGIGPQQQQQQVFQQQHHPHPHLPAPPQHQIDISHQQHQQAAVRQPGGPIINQQQQQQQSQPSVRYLGPPPQGQPLKLQQQDTMKVQFYGHEPHANVPPDMCLVGGVFLIVDYDRILDQKEVSDWRLVITLYGGEVETVYTSKCTHVICESLRHPVVQQALKEGKRCVTAQWLNDCLLQKRLQPPWKAVHFPSPYGDNKPCKNKIFTVCGFDANERSCLKNMILSIGGRYTAYLSRHNHFLIAKWYCLDDAKVAKAMEWKIQIVNVHFLTELFLGQAAVLQNISNPKYHQFLPREQPHPNMVDPFRMDASMLPPLMSAWRIPITFTNECWKNALDRKQKIENDDGKIFPHKKLKLSPAPEESEIQARRRSLAPRGNSAPKICFTGLYPAEVDNLSRKALWLCGEIVDDVKECTHLVASDLKRTQKLLDGIALGKFVVTPLWIRQSYKQQQFVDAIEYLVKDEGNEKFFGFNIKLSIYRARQGKLFQNIAFYLTPSVQPFPSVLRDLVQTAGGAVLQQRPPAKRILELQQQGLQLIVISCDNDLHLCQSLLDTGVAIHSAEFVLTGILRQEVDFTSYKIEPRQNETNAKTGRDAA